MLSGEPFIASTYSVPPIFAVPDGRMRFCALTALTTSVGVSPLASSAGMSMSTEICRALPPNGYGIATPGIETRRGRMKFMAVSSSAGSVMDGLDSPSCMTGMADAEYLMISGGCMPGGRLRSCAVPTATTSATAIGMLAFGWKKILMMDMPFNERDSMCSMSLTVAVIRRSFTAATRRPICWAESPL